MKGIKGASYAQIVFTVIETVIIFALIIAAFIEYGGKPAHMPSWEWISPFSFTPATFATGALIAVFFYWGWDVTMNLGEETVDGKPQPAGRGAFWAMVNLILFFIIMLIVVLIVLTDAEIEAANTNVLYASCRKAVPASLGLSGGAINHIEHHWHHRDADFVLHAQHVFHVARKNAASQLGKNSSRMADALVCDFGDLGDGLGAAVHVVLSADGQQNPGKLDPRHWPTNLLLHEPRGPCQRLVLSRYGENRSQGRVDACAVAGSCDRLHDFHRGLRRIGV